MNLKPLLKRNGWTQTDLARLLGVSTPSVSGYMTDRVEPPYYVVKKLYDLGATYSELFGDGSEDPGATEENQQSKKILEKTLNQQSKKILEKAILGNIDKGPQKLAALFEQKGFNLDSGDIINALVKNDDDPQKFVLEFSLPKKFSWQEFSAMVQNDRRTLEALKAIATACGSKTVRIASSGFCLDVGAEWIDENLQAIEHRQKSPGA